MIFNTEQLKAIEHGEGPALVLAGPGSGKTAVITGRTERLVKQCNIKPRRVLVITFTKAAAEEMRQRYEKEAAPDKMGVCFGTFHSVFFKILRESAGYSVNSLIKPEKRNAVVRRAYEALKAGRSYSEDDIKRLTSEISRIKNGKRGRNGSLPCTEEEFSQIFREYDAFLSENGQMDFDDILKKCRDLLENNAEARKYWQDAFNYILVDEYQDINRIQYETVKLLAAPKNNLFVVGDDDQSIYAFRGAEPALAGTFLKDFPDAARIVLNRNYRSASCITKAALDLIGHNGGRFEKDIRAASGKGSIKALCFEDRSSEYEALADRLLLGGTAGSAVLFRTNRQPRVLADVLERHNIKYTLADRFASLYDHSITQDLFAYARIAEGSRSRTDFLRICNRPFRYIKREVFDSGQVDLSKLKEGAGSLRGDIAGLLDCVEAIKGLNPFGVVMYLVNAAGYGDYLKEYAEETGQDEEELADILEELKISAKDVKNCAEWEKKLKKDCGSAAERSGNRAKEDDAVSLMTFHAAKGLEFENVYIIDLNEGISPIKHATETEMLEEERRAAYVAMTRAKTNLALMYVKKRGGRFVQPSRFIHEAGLD